MRRSVLFFTFVIATIGCGSDPGSVSETDDEQKPGEPTLETGIRPPVALDVDQIARVDEASFAAVEEVAEPPVSDRAPMLAPSCRWPALCGEARYRRHGTYR